MKKISINPKKSKLGLKAYCNYLNLKDDRGDFHIWFQPEMDYLKEIWEPTLGIQVQQGFLKPGSAPRGDHYHPHEKATDVFYLEQGEIILVLEDIKGEEQEFFHFDQKAVILFPPYVAHTVHNIGDKEVRFTTLRTWSFSVDPISIPYVIKYKKSDFKRAEKEAFQMPKNGMFGYKNMYPTHQKDYYLGTKAFPKRWQHYQESVKSPANI